MENVKCPYCGALVQAARWMTFETCANCGREYSVSNAVVAEKTDADVAALRAELERAARAEDYAALKAAAQAVSDVIPDDFTAAYYNALGEYKRGNVMPYLDFLRRADVSRAPEREREEVSRSVAENVSPDCERAARTFIYSALGSAGAKKYQILARERCATDSEPHPDIFQSQSSGKAEPTFGDVEAAETSRAEEADDVCDDDISVETGDAADNAEVHNNAHCSREYAQVLQSLKAFADEYDLENGKAAATEAAEAYPNAVEPRYWEFVFGLCDSYYIDSNKARTDITADMRNIVGKAYQSIAARFDGFFDSLPVGGRKVPALSVYEGLLPSAPDVERDYKKLVAERSAVVADADGEIAEICGTYGSKFGVSESGRADIDSLRNVRVSRVCKERDSRLADIDGALIRVKREIKDDADYFINFDKSVAERIVDGCKRDAVGYALDALTPEVVCDKLTPYGVERATDILGATTAAELTAFAYFAPCSPSVFADRAFLRLCECADAALRARLDALKAHAESVHKELCDALVYTLGEKLYADITSRLRLELELRIQTVKTKQSEIAAAIPIAKKKYRLRNFFVALFAVIAAAVIGGGLTGAVIFGSGWRAALCAIATIIACIAMIVGAVMASQRFAGCNAASVRDLERLREIYKAANADFQTANKAADSYLSNIRNL